MKIEKTEFLKSRLFVWKMTEDVSNIAHLPPSDEGGGFAKGKDGGRDNQFLIVKYENPPENRQKPSDSNGFGALQKKFKKIEKNY